MSPTVSVIMATKNAARYLRESLESIQAQTFEDYEVILVDANSDDATRDIAAEFDRVRVIPQVRRGFADAWNDGIREARGQYIAILDSDDRWVPSKLSLQVAFLEHHRDLECVIGRVRFFVNEDGIMPPTFRPELLKGDYIAHMPGATLVRREVFNRIGLFDPEMSVASDIDWFAKLKDHGIQEGIIDEVLIEKRVHGENLSYNGARESRYDRELLLTLRRSILRQRGIEAP